MLFKELLQKIENNDPILYLWEALIQCDDVASNDEGTKLPSEEQIIQLGKAIKKNNTIISFHEEYQRHLNLEYQGKFNCTHILFIARCVERNTLLLEKEKNQFKFTLYDGFDKIFLDGNGVGNKFIRFIGELFYETLGLHFLKDIVTPEDERDRKYTVELPILFLDQLEDFNKPIFKKMEIEGGKLNMFLLPFHYFFTNLGLLIGNILALLVGLPILFIVATIYFCRKEITLHIKINEVKKWIETADLRTEKDFAEKKAARQCLKIYIKDHGILMQTMRELERINRESKDKYQLNLLPKLEPQSRIALAIAHLKLECPWLDDERALALLNKANEDWYKKFGSKLKITFWQKHQAKILILIPYVLSALFLLTAIALTILSGGTLSPIAFLLTFVGIKVGFTGFTLLGMNAGVGLLAGITLGGIVDGIIAAIAKITRADYIEKPAPLYIDKYDQVKKMQEPQNKEENTDKTFSTKPIHSGSHGNRKSSKDEDSNEEDTTPSSSYQSTIRGGNNP